MGETTLEVNLNATYSFDALYRQSRRGLLNTGNRPATDSVINVAKLTKSATEEEIRNWYVIRSTYSRISVAAALKPKTILFLGINMHHITS